MTGLEVLNVIMVRLGTGSGVTSINTELNGVLYDITSRADFYTAVSVIETISGTIEYDEPARLKRIYECAIDGGGLLEKKTYREYLKAIDDGSAAAAGEPLYVARRRNKLYFWPEPDAVYNINVDHAGYHPETWTDILLGQEFNEAIFEGVLAAIYRGQLFEKLRLNNKKITNRDILKDTSIDRDISQVTDSDKDVSEVTDFDGLEDDGTTETITSEDSTVTTDADEDKTVTTADNSANSVATDDDTDAMTYEFDKDFPEITKHAEAYEAEIAKLISNMDMDMETILVEYRDI